MDTELSLDTVILEDHRRSQQVRAFFTSVIPSFRFSTYIQRFFRENAGSTYRMHDRRKRSGRRIRPIKRKKLAPQFESNRFIQDYFADPDNKSRTREDAIRAWMAVKSLPGDNKYRRDET